MARNILKTNLRKISQLTPTIVELDLEMIEPKQLLYKAGQFVMLNIPPKLDQKRPTLRAYSIASDANDSSGFKLVVKLVPNGVGSEFIRPLKNNAELGFTGPYGKLLFVEPPTEQVILLSTGAGISQHTSYLLTHGSKYPNTRFHMLIGVWNEKEIFYENILGEIKNRVKNFDYAFVLDKPLNKWTGLTGYVTNHIQKFDYKKINTTFYLCGNPAMVNNAVEGLKAEGIDQSKIHAEAFA